MALTAKIWANITTKGLVIDDVAFNLDQMIKKEFFILLFAY